MAVQKIGMQPGQKARNRPEAEFSIRRASLADADIVAMLGSQTFQDSYGQENDPETMARYLTSSFSKGQIVSELASPSAIFLLACLGNEAVGYAKLDAENIPECVTGPNPVRLVRLYVAHGYIGNGYGGALMKTCIKESCRKGYQTIWLGVWEQNKRAQRFYRKHGFRKAGFLDFVFGGETQQDIIMVMNIDNMH